MHREERRIMLTNICTHCTLLFMQATWVEMLRAQHAVKRALRFGKLTKKPCGICGSKESEAHHPDYSKALEVEWLCRKHHRLEHLRLGEPLVESWTVLNIRQVPVEVVKESKMVAVSLGITLRDLVIMAVQEFCKIHASPEDRAQFRKIPVTRYNRVRAPGEVESGGKAAEAVEAVVGIEVTGGKVTNVKTAMVPRTTVERWIDGQAVAGGDSRGTGSGGGRDKGRGMESGDQGGGEDREGRGERVHHVAGSGAAGVELDPHAVEAHAEAVAEEVSSEEKAGEAAVPQAQEAGPERGQASVEDGQDSGEARHLRAPEASRVASGFSHGERVDDAPSGLAVGARTVRDENLALAAEEKERIRKYRAEKGYPPMPGDAEDQAMAAQSLATVGLEFAPEALTHPHVLSSTSPTPRVVDTAKEAAEAALRMKKLPPTAKIAKAKKRVCKFCEGKLERWSATTLRCSACGRNEAL